MQTELKLSGVSGGSYEAGGNKATWSPRQHDPKVIDLYFREKRFEVTQEGTGPNGRPRFLVNRTRKPDGKLLQGRDITELIQKLDHFWPDLIEIPAGLARIEGKIDQLLQGKRRRESGQGKLCTKPVLVTWEQRRYVPNGAPGLFSRVPISLVGASPELAAGEYRLLETILCLAMGSGLLQAGKYKLGSLARIDLADVKRFRHSLCNRGYMRSTGRVLDRGIVEYELLTHPSLTGGTDLFGGGEGTSAGGERTSMTGGSFPPNKTSNKTSNNKTSNKTEAEQRTTTATTNCNPKLLALQAEERLLEQIGERLGWREQINKGGIWRSWMRKGPDHVRAIRNMLEKFRQRSDNYRKPIKNVGKWANDEYHRNLAEIQAAK